MSQKAWSEGLEHNPKHRRRGAQDAEIDGVRLLTSLAFEGYGAAIVPATSIPRWLKGDFKRIGVPDWRHSQFFPGDRCCRQYGFVLIYHYGGGFQCAVAMQ